MVGVVAVDEVNYLLVNVVEGGAQDARHLAERQSPTVLP